MIGTTTRTSLCRAAGADRSPQRLRVLPAAFVEAVLVEALQASEPERAAWLESIQRMRADRASDDEGQPPDDNCGVWSP